MRAHNELQDIVMAMADRRGEEGGDERVGIPGRRIFLEGFRRFNGNLQLNERGKGGRGGFCSRDLSELLRAPGCMYGMPGWVPHVPTRGYVRPP